MPQVVEERRKWKWRPLAIVGGAVVLSTLIGGAVWWLSLPSVSKVVSEANALNVQGRYREAEVKLNRVYGRAFTARDKAVVLSALAATNMNERNNDKALAYYLQADALVPNDDGTITAVAELAERMGKKDVAVKYYQQIVEKLKKGAKGPRTEGQIEIYQAHIAELQK